VIFRAFCFLAYASVAKVSQLRELLIKTL